MSSAKLLTMVIFAAGGLAWEAGGFAAERSLAIGLSAGFPDLLNFQAAWIRLGWLRFGYGLGTQPVDNLVRRFADLSAATQVYDIDDTYSVRPEPSFGLRSYNTFVRILPGTESFYLEAKYVSWRISADVEAVLINQVSGTEYSAGTVSFRIIQPLVGGGFGWQFSSESGFFLDVGIGAYALCRTDAAYGFSGALGIGLAGAVLDPAVHEKVLDAKEKANQQIEAAIRKMHETVPVVPGFYTTIGWAL